MKKCNRLLRMLPEKEKLEENPRSQREKPRKPKEKRERHAENKLLYYF